MAYLRAIVNPADDASLKRIINQPKRSIGDSTIAELVRHAAEKDMPLYSALVDIPETLSALRRQKNISQRTAAAELNISQALLSHYENGAREPGLSFVCRACDYYGVSADYILGRSDSAPAALSGVDALRELAVELRMLADKAENIAT